AYAPFKYSKTNGISGTIPDGFFTKLREFAIGKVAQFGEQLCQGNIQARPVAEACKHCDFHDICGRINQEDVTDVKDSVYEEKLMEELTDRKEKK
ncbi:hypothetical protein, partial [Ruminococcus sp.]